MSQLPIARRAAIHAIGATSVAGLAGCTGILTDDSNGDETDNDNNENETDNDSNENETDNDSSTDENELIMENVETSILTVEDVEPLVDQPVSTTETTLANAEEAAFGAKAAFEVGDQLKIELTLDAFETVDESSLDQDIAELDEQGIEYTETDVGDRSIVFPEWFVLVRFGNTVTAVRTGEREIGVDVATRQVEKIRERS